MKISRACIALLCAFASTAFAADRVWTGASQSSFKRWADRFNWEGDVAPAANDRLIFPATSIAKASYNDTPGVQFSGLVFTDPAGHTITTQNPPLSLNGPIAIAVEAAGGTFSTGPIGLATAGTRVTVNRPAGAAGSEVPVLMPGVLSLGPGRMRLEATTGRIVISETVNATDASSLELAGAVELSGRAPHQSIFRIVDGAIVKVRSVYGLGAPSPLTFVFGGRLEIGPFLPDENQGFFDEALQLAGPPQPELGNVSTVIPTFRGSLRIDGTQTFVGGPMIFAGQIQGAGVMRLKVTGNSYATYTSTDNSLIGPIEVAQGTLLVQQHERIPDLVPVTVGPAGTLQMGAGGSSSAIRETIRSLACSGRLTFLEAGVATLRVMQPSSIAGCELALAPGALADPSRAITLIANESGQPFAGAFSNAPEGTGYTINGSPMRLTYHGGTGNDIALVPSTTTTAPAVQDMWWAGPAENGWGMSIVQHGEKLFGVIYAYDALGAPTWFVMSAGTWNAAHTEYTGDVYTPSGAPYFAYDPARFVVGSKVGTITLAFTDAQHATLRYTINGLSDQKAIVRQQFGPAATHVHSDYGDMWWGGVAQNGWGISVIQQFESVFLVWFTYDAAGVARWYVVPAGDWSGNRFAGRIYRTTGSPWVGRPYDVSLFRVIEVGFLTVRFDEPGLVEYNLDGRQGTLPLTRNAF